MGKNSQELPRNPENFVVTVNELLPNSLTKEAASIQREREINQLEPNNMYSSWMYSFICKSKDVYQPLIIRIYDQFKGQNVKSQRDLLVIMGNDVIEHGDKSVYNNLVVEIVKNIAPKTSGSGGRNDFEYDSRARIAFVLELILPYEDSDSKYVSKMPDRFVKSRIGLMAEIEIPAKTNICRAGPLNYKFSQIDWESLVHENDPITRFPFSATEMDSCQPKRNGYVYPFLS